MKFSDFKDFDSKGLNISHMQSQYDLLALHQANPKRYPFLLESVAQPDNNDEQTSSRFDILFAFPQQTLSLSADNKLEGIDNIQGNDFLDNLSRWWQSAHFNNTFCETLPFHGGWFIYLAYELAQQIEPQLKLKLSTTDNAYATRIPAAIIYDHQTSSTYCLSEEGFDYITLLENDCSQHKVQAETVENKIPSKLYSQIVEENESQYLNAITKIKKYIFDGDVFQVNLSRLWQANKVKEAAATIYRKLRESNPAPFAGIATHKNFSVMSSSPERLIKISNGIAETRPIAGTRRREQNQSEDNALKEELIKHPKERAEHIMLIDLERNDLGRICKPGSIEVDEMMALESYAHVHHIVSNVKGELKENILPGDAIKAVFPGGTITGCPKVRCMEIIAELETEPRGAYTGSMGYLNHNGDMDINILIRTMTVEGDTLRFRAGAGLVVDSVSESELEETRHKARGLLLALK